MGKDSRARADGRITVTALANLVAAITHTMRSAGVPGEVTHEFLDRLDDLNLMTLDGLPLQIMGEVIDVVRRTIPSND